MASALTAVIGNIVRQPDCDAIVNSANANLRAGSGVCGAIYRAAGAELEPHSSRLAPLDLAHAVTTPGFKLPNCLIIHCRGPRYLFDPEPALHLARCMENTLRLAEELGVRRLAVPAISMGVYAYPAEEAVPILIDVAHRMARDSQTMQEIRFVLTSPVLHSLFQSNIDALG